MYMKQSIKILVTCMRDDIFYEALMLVTQEMKNVILDKKITSRSLTLTLQMIINSKTYILMCKGCFRLMQSLM